MAFFRAAGALVSASRLKAASIAAIFVLFGYVYYYPYLVPPLTNRLIFGTEEFVFHQFYYFIWDKFQHWETPLWNPYMLSGVPIFANVGFGFLNPVSVLGAFFYDPSASFLANTRVFVYLTLTAVFIGNVGMYLLLRGFGTSRPVAAVGSLWFSYSGVNLVKNIYVEEAVINYLYPWLLLFFFRYLKGGKARYLFLIAAALAVVVSTTHVILIGVTFMHLALLTSLSLVFDRKGAVSTSKREGVLPVGLSRRFFLFIPLGAACVMASTSILPYVEYIRNASSGITPATLGQVGQVDPERGLLSVFLMPFADNYPVLGLITAAGIFLYRREEKKYVFAMLLLSFLMGLKQYGAIERLLYIFTPFGQYLLSRHFHYYVWFYAPVYATVLFACGLEFFFEKTSGDKRLPYVLLAAGVIVILAVGYGLNAGEVIRMFLFKMDPASYNKTPLLIVKHFKAHPLDESRLIVCFLLLVFFASLLLMLSDRVNRAWAKAACAFVLLAVILTPLHRWYFDSLGATVQYVDAAAASPRSNAGSNFDNAAPMPWRQAVHARRGMTLNNHYDAEKGRFGKDTTVYRREYDINGIARIWPKRYKEFLLAANLPVLGFQDDLWKVERGEGPVDWRLARLLSVNPEDIRLEIGSGEAAGFNSSAYPGVFDRFEIITDYIVVREENGILPKMKGIDLRRFVVLEDEPSFAFTSADATSGGYKGTAGEDGAAMTEFSEKRMKLTVRSAHRRAFLFHSQNFYPGWKATVDGEDVPLYRANYTFQAIPIGRGEHEVVLYFDPMVFKISKWISMIALLSFSVLFVLFRKRTLPEVLSLKGKGNTAD